MTCLTAEQNEILNEIATQPNNQDLMKERREIEDQILKCEIDLNDEVEMIFTDNKNMAHSNAWHSHRETTEGLKKGRGKVYSLLLSQCTQVLVDKIKQDTTWVMVSESFDPILLFKLIKKFVLKQSDNQYKTAVLIAKQLPILSFHQDDQMPNATYYNQFNTRVEVACQTGGCYYTPDLLDTKCVELSCTEYETLTPAKQKNVRDVVEQEYLVYLFINNSNQKLHSQLEKDMASDYSKGNMEAHPSDIRKALAIMNDYKLLKLDVAPMPAQGTAFATTSRKRKGEKASSRTKYISNSDWKVMSP